MGKLILRLKPHTQRHLLVFLRGRGRMGRTDWEEALSGEMIAIVAVGVAFAGVILTSLKGTETRLREDMKQLSERVARVEHSQAKLEGLLEGLREAITGRVKAS